MHRLGMIMIVGFCLVLDKEKVEDVRLQLQLRAALVPMVRAERTRRKPKKKWRPEQENPLGIYDLRLLRLSSYLQEKIYSRRTCAIMLCSYPFIHESVDLRNVIC